MIIFEKFILSADRQSAYYIAWYEDSSIYTFSWSCCSYLHGGNNP